MDVDGSGGDHTDGCRRDAAVCREQSTEAAESPAGRGGLPALESWGLWQLGEWVGNVYILCRYIHTVAHTHSSYKDLFI